jgi:hypothetical protein
MLEILNNKSNNKSKKHIFYESSQTNFHSVDGKEEGIRKSVSIKNGLGVKKVEKLGKDGAIVSSKTRKLSKDEINNIREGNFVPGLWTNCKLGNCKKTIKNQTNKRK